MNRLRDRVVEELASRPGQSMCVGCIAKMLDASHKSAHEATLKLEARPGFSRAYGRCALCGKTRIVTTRRSAATIPATADGSDGM